VEKGGGIKESYIPQGKKETKRKLMGAEKEKKTKETYRKEIRPQKE